MANVLSVYDPLFYAQEALIALEKALGLAGRVHRGYDKAPQQKGSIISIRKPSTFAAADAPSDAQDISAGEVQIALDHWREVKFKLTDKELSATGETIIQEHIRPAAYALADDIDQKLAALYKNVPWFKAASAPVAVGDITGVRAQLFNNRAPMSDGLHFMVDGTVEAELLNLANFSQQAYSGDAAVQTALRGTMGQRFGFEFFANQNVQTHTGGTLADAAGALTAAAAKGATQIAVDGLTADGTIKVGDTFVIAGNTQRYTVTEDITMTDGTATVKCFPALVQAHADNDVVTFDVTGGTQSMAFHRNAFALAMAPLSEIGNGIGAQIATVVDPITNLALRSRLFYVGNDSAVYVALDVLYGIKTLEPNLAVRFVN